MREHEHGGNLGTLTVVAGHEEPVLFPDGLRSRCVRTRCYVPAADNQINNPIMNARVKQMFESKMIVATDMAR